MRSKKTRPARRTAKASTSSKSSSKAAPKRRATSASTKDMDKVVRLLRKMAPTSYETQKLGKPGSAADIDRVAKALGVTLPAELVAMWREHGEGIPIFEYAAMSPARALERRAGLEELRVDGTFDDHELFPQREPRIQKVKWHTKWLPIAEDGGGNLWLVDFAPGKAGVVGQVIKWEIRGGAGTTGSITLRELFARYAAALPKFKYDESSGTFDGPFIDLTA